MNLPLVTCLMFLIPVVLLCFVTDSQLSFNMFSKSAVPMSGMLTGICDKGLEERESKPNRLQLTAGVDLGSLLEPGGEIFTSNHHMKIQL